MIPELSNARMKPYDHQVVGVNALVENQAFALFDEMGAGKTKQVIDAAQVLAARGVIDTVVIIAPADVRGVWFEPRYGEIKKHHWENIEHEVHEFHSKTSNWTYEEVDNPLARIKWVITNYEFIIRKTWRDRLLKLCNEQTFLVLDESSMIKNWKAARTKACGTIRKKCGRVVLLNGTPIDNSPGDMFSQGNMMDPRILDCVNWWQFRGRYAVLGGFGRLAGKLIVDWQNLGDLQRRFKPYVLRRLKDDCLDLPEKMPPVTVSVSLDKATWERYTDLRDDLVTWLSSTDAVVVQHTITKIMRLSQLTSGFVGGIEETEDDERPDFLPSLEPVSNLVVKDKMAVISDEKLRWWLTWIGRRFEEDSKTKMIIWARFRPELDRLINETRKKFPHVNIGAIRGAQKKKDRQYAIDLLSPETSPNEPCLVFGNSKSGGMGLNLTAANIITRISHEWSLAQRLQSDDRIHRPGQTRVVSYYDVVATGPDGQRTIDHVMIDAVNTKNDLAKWTASQWIQEITRE